MKILVSIAYYAPYISGLSLCAQHIIEGLEKKGSNITVLTTQYKKMLPFTEKINSVEVVRVPYLFAISKGFVMPAYIFEVFKYVKKNDIVLINMPQAEAVIVACIARFLGKPILTIYHCELQLPKTILNTLIQWLLPVSIFPTL